MAKIPLVLVPGLLCDQEVWQYQIENLNDIAEITVPDLSTAATPDALVAAVLTSAPAQRFCLAGYSMGAWLAAEVAIQHPKRVMKLCLISTNVDVDTSAKITFRKGLIESAKTGKMEPIVDQLANLFAPNATPLVLFQIKSMLSRNAKAFISQEEAMLMRRNCLPLLNAIDCPTFIIHGDKDAVFLIKDAEIIQEHITHSKLQIVKDSDHMVTMEKPQEIAGLMRLWLMDFEKL